MFLYLNFYSPTEFYYFLVTSVEVFGISKRYLAFAETRKVQGETFFTFTAWNLSSRKTALKGTQKKEWIEISCVSGKTSSTGCAFCSVLNINPKTFEKKLSRIFAFIWYFFPFTENLTLAVFSILLLVIIWHIFVFSFKLFVSFSDASFMDIIVMNETSAKRLWNVH